jgi:hypothetical protein
MSEPSNTQLDLADVIRVVEKRLSAVERNGIGVSVTHVGDMPCSVCLSYQKAVRDVLKTVRANLPTDPDSE